MPEPETLLDGYATRGHGAAAATMRVNPDLNEADLKGAEPPAGLSEEDTTRWRYQRHIKDYLRVCASMDDNIGRVLDYLDTNGLRENTIIVYTSDHGLFLGEHGWFDKRFMYEEALSMPFVVRTDRYKLIPFYNSAPGIVSAKDEREPEYWEFYDLDNDPKEVNNRIDDPVCAEEIAALKVEFERLRLHYGDSLPETKD
jgi:arylsulfatase A-like enzyme